jgi:hypothetical protein
MAIWRRSREFAARVEKHRLFIGLFLVFAGHSGAIAEPDNGHCRLAVNNSPPLRRIPHQAKLERTRTTQFPSIPSPQLKWSVQRPGTKPALSGNARVRFDA